MKPNLTYFIGRLGDLVAALKAPYEPVGKIPETNILNEYEKLWNQVKVLPKWEPVYLKIGLFYYQLIDECTYVEVSLITQSKGAYKQSFPDTCWLFYLFSSNQYKKLGYEHITAPQFHQAYSEAQNEMNLLVNKALSA